jgi:large subunit ribosomal protein L5
METYTPRLKKKYKDEIIPALIKEFNYKSIMEVPHIEKIVLNRGVGTGVSDKKMVDIAQEELTQIAGQKAIQIKSKKAINNFKLKENVPIGTKVTLRHERMYEFLERLLCFALPRIKDFNGIGTKFDGRGNYSLGIEEQIIFPEINLDGIEKIMGMEITFVTSAKTDEEAFALLKQFEFPFKEVKSN